MEGIQKRQSKIEESFPFKPYNIQLEFSFNLYDSLSTKKLCIFESPTGTGKSLSLICGAFNWLRDNQENYDILKEFKERRQQIRNGINENEQKKEDSNSLPAWLSNVNDINKSIFEERIQIQKNKLAQKAQSLKDFLMFRKEKMKIRYEEFQRSNFQKDNPVIKSDIKETDDDSQYCVNWSESGGEKEDIEAQIEDYKKYKIQHERGNKKQIEQAQEEEEDNELAPIRIIYASRTHTQIKQFVEEILKTKFKDLRIITLGSRQNLCINKNIDSQKHTLSQIDDYCQKAIGINKSDKTIQKCEQYTNLRLLEKDIDFLFLESIHTIDQMRQSSQNNQVFLFLTIHFIILSYFIILAINLIIVKNQIFISINPLYYFFQFLKNQLIQYRANLQNDHIQSKCLCQYFNPSLSPPKL